MLRSTAVAAITAVSLLSACGSSKSDDAATTTKAAAAPAATAPAATPTTPAATTTAPATTTTTPAPKVTKKQILAQCHAAYGPVVTALRHLDGAATVGNGYAAYKAAVSKAQADFGKADFRKAPKVSSSCVKTVVTSSVKAIQTYIAATTTWSECAKDKGCSDASVAPKLRSQWKAARRLIHDAEAGFSDSSINPSL